MKKLWDEYKTIFYDPCILFIVFLGLLFLKSQELNPIGKSDLYYEVPGKNPVLYAVPVLVKNYVENGQAINRGTCTNKKYHGLRVR